MTEKKLSIKLRIQELISSNEYVELEEFQHSKIINSLEDEDKYLLARLFIRNLPQIDLDKNALCLVDTCDFIISLTPYSVENLFEVGLFIKNIREEFFLKEACTLFEEVTNLDPKFVEAWCAWGDALLTLADLKSDLQLLKKASLKFNHAFELSDEFGVELVWCKAKCLRVQGKISGEAIDFVEAIKFFKQAAQSSPPYPSFWNEYGNTLSELGQLLGKQEHLKESLEFYQKAVEIEPNFPMAWLNQALVYKQLYISSDINSFDLSNQCFEKASALLKDHFELFCHWGHLLLEGGQEFNDIQKIESSHKLLKKAFQLDPENSFNLALLTESEILLGEFNENLSHLRSAEKNILRCIKHNPEDANVWGLWGSCLKAFGHYFTDESYFNQAIEKFQHSLSLDSSNPNLWSGLACCFFHLGEMKNEAAFIEKSIHYFSRSLEFDHSPPLQFWNEFGIALYKLGDLLDDDRYVKKAVEKFEHGLALLPSGSIEAELFHNYACALDFLGSFHDDASQFEKAADLLLRVLEVEPQNYDVTYQLALTLYHFGDSISDVESLQRACDVYQSLVSKDPEDESSWNGWGLSLISMAILVEDSIIPQKSENYFIEAEEKLSQAVALGCEMSYYNLACLYSLTNRFALAIHFLQRAELSGTLPTIDDILNDEWLEKIQSDHDFKMFIHSLSARKKFDE